MSPKRCRTVVVEMGLEMTQLTHCTKTVPDIPTSVSSL